MVPADPALAASRFVSVVSVLPGFPGIIDCSDVLLAPGHQKAQINLSDANH